MPQRLIDQRDYTHYVILGDRIESGWSYASDARDAVREGLPANLHPKVYARRTLVSRGIDPKVNANWLTSADMAALLARRANARKVGKATQRAVESRYQAVVGKRATAKMKAAGKRVEQSALVQIPRSAMKAITGAYSPSALLRRGKKLAKLSGDPRALALAAQVEQAEKVLQNVGGYRAASGRGITVAELRERAARGDARAASMLAVIAAEARMSVARKSKLRVPSAKRANTSKAPSTKVQSLLFDRVRFSREGAIRWATAHGYKADKVDVTKNTIRLRQFSPKRGRKGRWGTVPFGANTGIQAVVTVPKKRAEKRANPTQRTNAHRKGPSVATLARMLGPYLAQEGHDPKVAAKQIKAAMQVGRRHALEVANKLLRGHGIESIGDFNNYPPRPELDYVNMGDLYNTTLVYDYRSKRFVATDIGAIMERNERRFRDL